MTIEINGDATVNQVSTTSITSALDQSERVKDLVEECADELSSINTTLAHELVSAVPPPPVAEAIEKSQMVEVKVQDASERLAIVNATLKGEVRERNALEDRVVALTEQRDADRYASLHDPLTGLPNRALFNDRLAQGLAQADRHGWTLAVMFLDLNNFKNINDTYGHEAGDSVLKIISDRLKNITRRDDTLCRHGGDEFLYLLAEIGEEKYAAVIAEKIICAIQAPLEIKVGNASLALTIGASIGIALWPTHGKNGESLISRADAAMYEAKRSGSGYSFALPG